MRLSLALVLSRGLIGVGLIGTSGCPAPAEVADAATLRDAFAPDAATLGVDAFGARDAFAPGVDAFTPDALAAVDAYMAPDAYTRDALAAVDAYTAPDAYARDAPAPSCACANDGFCLEVSASNCSAIPLLCGGSPIRTESCPRDGVLYTCGPNSTGGATYFTSYFFADYDAQARSCASVGGATLTTTPPPPPDGEACGCQRTASACVEVYGPSACSTLACTSPATRIAGECPSAGTTPGECVSFNGQRRFSYYGVTSARAQLSCRGLTGYYWVPAA